MLFSEKRVADKMRKQISNNEVVEIKEKHIDLVLETTSGLILSITSFTDKARKNDTDELETIHWVLPSASLLLEMTRAMLIEVMCIPSDSVELDTQMALINEGLAVGSRRYEIKQEASLTDKTKMRVSLMVFPAD